MAELEWGWAIPFLAKFMVLVMVLKLKLS